MRFFQIKKTSGTQAFGAAAVLLALAAPAGAEPATVKAGQSRTFGPLFLYTKQNCEFFPPSHYAVGSAPKHGKVTMATRKLTLPGDAEKCAGSTGYALFMTYTPERGYRGADQFRFNYNSQRYLAGPVIPSAETVHIIVE